MFFIPDHIQDLETQIKDRDERLEDILSKFTRLRAEAKDKIRDLKVQVSDLTARLPTNSVNSPEIEVETVQPVEAQVLQHTANNVQAMTGNDEALKERINKLEAALRAKMEEFDLERAELDLDKKAEVRTGHHCIPVEVLSDMLALSAISVTGTFCK